MKTDTLRRKCRKLANELGCTIEYEREIDVYWVYGPDEVYNPPDDYVPGEVRGRHKDTRRDLREGNHNCYSYEEVWNTLQDYRIDLMMHWLGLSAEDFDTIQNSNGGLLAPLLEPKISCPEFHTRSGILADWLEEYGDAGVATRFRKAMAKMQGSRI